MTDTAVVPILPTPDMLRAGVGWRETDTTEGLSPEASQCDRIWRVMVAAAPALPPAGGAHFRPVGLIDVGAFDPGEPMPMQLAKLAIAALEEEPGWIDSPHLVTARAHLAVLIVDHAAALSPTTTGEK